MLLEIFIFLLVLGLLTAFIIAVEDKEKEE